MATEADIVVFPSQRAQDNNDDDDDDDDDDVVAVVASAANPSISRVLADLRRSDLSMGNRLRSILADASFARSVSAAYGGRPLVANERCGSWYVPPDRRAASAYFKSTDGHAGQWRFSARRLNLHLLRLAGARDGCVVVDSTRRGKLMPDALSKTLPVWCCVLNRVLFPELLAAEGGGEEGDGDGVEGEGEGEERGGSGSAGAGAGYYHALYTPPQAVSRSEHAQIEARIPAHVASLRALAGAIDFGALRRQVRKPLRPIWVTPESYLPPPPPPSENDSSSSSSSGGGGGGGGDDSNSNSNGSAVEVFADFHPVICCTASRREAAASSSGHAGGYVQGAADDTENWALGLTPDLFWERADELAGLPEAELPGRVRELVAAAAASTTTATATATAATTDSGNGPRQLAPRVYVARLPLPAADDDDGAWCTITFERAATDPDSWVKGPRRMALGVGKNAKLAGRNLRVALPRVCDFVRGFFCGRPVTTSSSSPSPSLSSSAAAAAAAAASSNDNEEGEENGRRDHKDEKEEEEEEEERERRRAVLIACETGGDLSVGVALALLCRCFDDEGRCLTYEDDDDGGGAAGAVVVNKDVIRLKLSRIMMAFPEANPSRTTLQSVNSFLMS
ncbi:tRNA A64-2'-O-ribosylphosphate transferase [Biscogniauxia marginata]|nr:tRNA A64-2'-O-ribosylphosphate transferase [Biscogniauxia marginata]